MLNQGNIFSLEDARIARNTIKQLGLFLSCEINDHNAVNFIKTLVKNGMLYYFEEEAEFVVDYEGEYIFTHNQATLLNLIRDRFKEDPFIYNKLFNEVENNFSSYCAI